jgi:hypothetical protein
MKYRTTKEKELADQARLTRAWRNWHREEREAVLAGPYARTLAELFRMFANLKHVTPAQLIGFVGAIDWGSIDHQTRLTVLHELNTAITRYRERHGLEPISDPLPNEPDSPYRTIKAILFPERAPTGAQPGSNTETPVT